MRLNELHVDGFGHFRDHVVGSLDSNVTVLHGPNEAGKSTLLAFIRTILFGFPLRGRDDHYPPLAGGRHGGRISLVDDDGEIYTLERFAGPRGGRPVLRTSSTESRRRWSDWSVMPRSICSATCSPSAWTRCRARSL